MTPAPSAVPGDLQASPRVERNCPDGSGANRSCPRVAILLCTYQGQQYLQEQLDSFLAQTHRNWEIRASDDGSQDDTVAILRDFGSRLGEERLSVRSGPRRGFAANFLSLTCAPEIEADYYAYSDQDDVWEADKLARALEWLQGLPDDVPALYCSRTRLIDEANREIGLSPLFKRPPCFANALAQSIGGGNTMVFNNAARGLLREAGDDVDVITHDWWAYLVVSGCGGEVRYDTYPSIRYRQHDENLVGVNSTWRARIVRIRMMWHGRFREWNDRNLRALERLRPRLMPENQRMFDRFLAARNASLLQRLIGLQRSGIFRQTLLGNLGLVAAAVLGRI